MEEDIIFWEQKIVSAEKQIEEGKELTEERYKELGNIASALINNKSEKAKDLQKRIIRVQNNHHTIRNVNYIRELEAAHDRLKEEFLNPSTSEDRKKQLADESREISEILQILQR